MSKVLSIVALLLLLVAGVLGFLNKEKYDKTFNELTETQGILADTQDDLAQTTKEKEATEQRLAAETEKLLATEDELSDTKTRLDESEAKVSSLQTDLDAKTQLVAKLEQDIEALKLTDESGEELSAEEFKAQVEEMKLALDAAEEEKKILVTRLEAEQQAAETLREAERQRQERIMVKSLEGTVLAYNPAWNFVVINLGDKNGVVGSAEFLVKRGATAVGRVKVTSVEPSTSIADVIPSSLTAGLTIQPGDRVIVPPGS